MTIKEMEQLSGIPRANIRFYESEGFLNPKREKNGYRNYSEQDLEVIMKIKLLRALNISLEEIKLLHQGSNDLIYTLDSRLEEMKREQRELERSGAICRTMRDDCVTYQTLDAQHYLEKLEQLAQTPAAGKQQEQNTIEKLYKAWQESDMIEKVHAPWRRFWARMLDLTIYKIIWYVFLSLLFHMNLQIWIKESSKIGILGDIIDIAVPLVMMCLIEPLLLSWFGTTIGKRIMGFQITNSDGGKLSYRESRERTAKVIWMGLGCQIPVYILIRLWKSYKTNEDGRELDWEEGNVLTLKDEEKWRFVGLAGAYLCLFLILYSVICIADLPKHRGELTVAQFCENFNEMAAYYEADTDWYLNEEGLWRKKQSMTESFIIEMSERIKPSFQFSEEDGYITAISITAELKDVDWINTGCTDEIIIAIKAFVQAQKSYGIFSDKVWRLSKAIGEEPFEDFECELCGIEISCDQYVQGFAKIDGGILIPEGKGNWYKLELNMIKK